MVHLAMMRPSSQVQIRPLQFDQDMALLHKSCEGRDSSLESSMVAGMHEQTHTPDLQDHELAGL
jgi:mRNA-degrading endonuclease YafQ of YafQ-DinJ toxin-antitoxin module